MNRDPPPDFLWSLSALAKFMRLSLMKAAHAVVSGAAYRKSGLPLTAQTRQQILRVYRFGQNLEFVSLGTGAVQEIRGGSLA